MTREPRRQRPARQRGATLVVALIFLAILSLFAVAAYKSSSTNLRVVGAMQARQEGLAAAQVALEAAISTTDFAYNPSGFVTNNSPTNVDIDNNGVADYRVSFATPACYRALAIKNSSLDVTSANDRSCIVSSGAVAPGLDSALAPPASDSSLCANSEWDLAASVVDTSGVGARVVVHQGVGMRIVAADADNYCK